MNCGFENEKKMSFRQVPILLKQIVHKKIVYVNDTLSILKSCNVLRSMPKNVGWMKFAKEKWSEKDEKFYGLMAPNYFFFYLNTIFVR